MDEEGAYQRLVGACPGLFVDDGLAAWVACFEEEDRPDRYVRLAALAHHVVDAAAAGRGDEVGPVLDAAEGVLDDVAADGDAVALVRMGLVEPLQNICSHDDVPLDPEDLVPLLGRRTRQVWDEADVLWRRAAAGATSEPLVTVEHYRQVADPDLRRYLQSGRRRLPDGRLMAANDIVRFEQGRSVGAPSGAGRGSGVGWVVVAVLALVVAVAVIAIV